MSKTCGTCRHWTDLHDEGWGICTEPTGTVHKDMPVAGDVYCFVNRDATDCPCYEKEVPGE